MKTSEARRRLRSARLAAVLAAALAALPPSAAGAQDLGVAEAVDSLLLFTELPSFVAAAEGAFEEHFVRLSTRLAALEAVRDAAPAAFADSLLVRDVAAYLAEDADPERLRTLLGWLGSGATARLRAVTDTTPTPQTFDAFLEELETSPPDPRRVALVRRWAEVQRAGDFLLLLDEAQRQAAHRVAAAVDPEAPAFAPIGGEAFAVAHAQAEAYAILSFLHRLQPVTSSTLEAAVAEYDSDAGRWFVEAYSLALAHAVREASRRLAEAVEPPAR